MPNLEQNIAAMNNSELWSNYALTIGELKKRKLVRTGNITGERGEQLAIEIYNSTPEETKLQAAPQGTRNVDALSRKGERYSIKTVTLPGKLTGTFHGLNPPDSKNEEPKIFEYLVVVMLDDLCQPVKILECTWNVFIKYKRWHGTMKAWNISVTGNFEKESRVVFRK